MTTAVWLVPALAALLAGGALLVARIAVPSGVLLVATAVAIPFGQLDEPPGPALLALTLLLGGAAAALAAATGVLWPITPPTRADVAAVALALGCTLILGGLAPTLFADPVADGCNACSPNPLAVALSPAVADALDRLATASALLWGPLLVLVALRRIRAASPLARRQAWPLGAGAGIAALAAVAAGRALTLPADVADPAQQDIQAVQAALLGVVAVGAVARLSLAATAGRRMARIVLAAMPEEGLVVDSLRRASADPTLELRYLRADGSAIDADGRPVADQDGPVLRLSRGGQDFAEVRHGPVSAGALAVLRSSAASAGLALEYLAAQARLRAELRDAAAVRARLVTAGSAERRRLERDLHDGAQQRLVALGLMLGMTAAARPLDREHAEIDAALQELRTIARGLFPAGLSESGLVPALRELGDHTGCPLVVKGAVGEPVPLAVKTAVYELVSETAGLQPPDAALQVTLSGGGDAPLAVVLTGVLAEREVLRAQVLNAEDRFVAAGGRLRIRVADGGIVVEGEAPCAS